MLFYGDTKVRFETLNQSFPGCIVCPDRRRGRSDCDSVLEIGIDLSANRPRKLTDELAGGASLL